MTESVWYAGRWRTPEGVERHRAATWRRFRRPVNRIKADLASNHAKRDRSIRESRTP